MFGSGKFEHMVEKNQWDKLNSKLTNANDQTKLEIAVACSKSSEDESMNILVRLLQDSNDAVQLQAIKSLGLSGRPSIKSHLNWLSERIPESNEAAKQAIREAFSNITKRQ
jgi:hypothetical protein